MTSSKDHTPLSSWPPAGAPLDAVQDAFSQAHSAVQWLARMVNSFSVPASDGSHLHMRWRADVPAIVSPEIAENTCVEMRLPEMVLQFVENGDRTKHEVELDDKSPAQIEAWTLIELLHRGIDRDAYSKHLPYDVTHLLGGDAHDYQTFGREQAFADITDWLRHGAQIVEQIGQTAASDGLGATSELRFAPETFSLFVRIHPDNDRPAVGSFVEVGFCAGNTPDHLAHFYAATPNSTERKTVSIEDIISNTMSQADVSVKLAVDDLLESLNGQ